MDYILKNANKLQRDVILSVCKAIGIETNNDLKDLEEFPHIFFYEYCSFVMCFDEIDDGEIVSFEQFIGVLMEHRQKRYDLSKIHKHLMADFRKAGFSRSPIQVSKGEYKNEGFWLDYGFKWEIVMDGRVPILVFEKK